MAWFSLMSMIQQPLQSRSNSFAKRRFGFFSFSAPLLICGECRGVGVVWCGAQCHAFVSAVAVGCASPPPGAPACCGWRLVRARIVADRIRSKRLSSLSLPPPPAAAAAATANSPVSVTASALRIHSEHCTLALTALPLLAHHPLTTTTAAAAAMSATGAGVRCSGLICRRVALRSACASVSLDKRSVSTAVHASRCLHPSRALTHWDRIAALLCSALSALAVSTTIRCRPSRPTAASSRWSTQPRQSRRVGQMTNKSTQTDRLRADATVISIRRPPPPPSLSCFSIRLASPRLPVFHTPVSSAPLARGVDEDTTVIRIRKILFSLLFHFPSCASLLGSLRGLDLFLPRCSRD